MKEETKRRKARIAAEEKVLAARKRLLAAVRANKDPSYIAELKEEAANYQRLAENLE